MTESLDKARNIVRAVAEHRKRWGKMADGDFASFHEYEVADALVAIYDAGILDMDFDQLKDGVVLANRQKGAAEARATKYKKQIDELKDELREYGSSNEALKAIVSDLRDKLTMVTADRDARKAQMAGIGND